MVFESPIEEAGSKNKSEVVRLREDEGLTYKQIAERLGKTEASVKMKYRRDIGRVTERVTQGNAKVTESNAKVTEKVTESNGLGNAEVTQQIKSEVKKQLKEEVYKEMEEAKQGVLKDIREEIEEFKTEIMREIKKTQGQNAFIKNMLREYLGSEKYEEIKNKIVQNSEN